MQTCLKINARGLRVGQDHHRAKLTDHEVDLIRELYGPGWGYGRLAEKFEVAKATIRDIVLCRKRAQVVAGHRAVCLTRG